jgi:hypothetical protein
MLKEILAVLMSLPPSYKDHESWAEREVRMTTIAVAIDDSGSRATCTGEYATSSCRRMWNGSKRDLVYLLLERGNNESHFALRIHEGNCDSNECDSYRHHGVVYFRAHSPWQIHQQGPVSKEEWDGMLGTDLESTKIAAWAATKILSYGFNSCKSIIGAIGIYAGKGCYWQGATERYVSWQTLRNKSLAEFQSLADKRKSRALEREEKLAEK